MNNQNKFLNQICLMNNLKQQQMEEKPLTKAQLDKVSSRRSRKDEEGRDFQCGCGKRYLSYPALYTHVKTKHCGVQPSGTQKTGLVIKKVKAKIDDEVLKNISLNFVQKEDLKILKQIDGNYLGQVPIQTRIKRQTTSKEISQYYNNLVRVQQQVKLTPNSPLDLVLTVYLLNVGQYINEKMYDYYLIFAKLARGCFAEHGQEIYRNCFSKKDGGAAYLQHFSNTEVKYFPIVCDFLTRYYIPCSESVRQCRDINISLVELLLYDFCKWLLRKKLTFINVELKKQYKLDSKPFLLVRQRCISHKNQLAKENDNKDEESNSEEQKKQNDIESSSQMNPDEMEQEMNGHASEEEEYPKQKNRGQIIKTIALINNTKQYFQLQKKEVQAPGSEKSSEKKSSNAKNGSNSS